MTARSLYYAKAEELITKPDRSDEVINGTRFRREGTEPEILAAIGQPFAGWDIGQDFALNQVVCMRDAGFLGVIQFGVYNAPRKDSERECNQERLNELRWLSAVDVEATVHRDQTVSPDGDGVFVWNSEIETELCIPGALTRHKAVVQPKGQVPLEIGYTDASTTVSHLMDHGGVARWAYGHQAVYLILPVHRVDYAYPVDNNEVTEYQRYEPIRTSMRSIFVEGIMRDPWPTVPRDKESAAVLDRIYSNATI